MTINVFKYNFKFIMRISFFKTIYFNLKYFSLYQAIRVPVLISKNVILYNISGKIIINSPIETGMIRIGFGDVSIFDRKNSRSIWDVLGTVVFNGISSIGHGSKISVAEKGKLVLGKNFVITAETTIIASIRIQIGDDCLLSWETLIMDTDFHRIKVNNLITNSPEPIIIGNNVWIGCRCLIMKGSLLPNNCVIGANSVVNKKLVTERSIYAGNPVRWVKSDILWIK